MPTREENSPPYSEADYYGQFMTALMGLEDDAALAGYSEEGIDQLRKAIGSFMVEFRERHPGQWDSK